MTKKHDLNQMKQVEYAVPDLRGTAKTKWTIAGVSSQTRTAVKKAAHREGDTIGGWVDKTLHAAATNSLKGGSPVLSLPPELLETIDDISSKLDRIHYEFEHDPERFTSFSLDFGEVLNDARNRISDAVGALRKTTIAIVDSAADQTDAAVTQSKQIADKSLERIIDAGDAALDSVRQLRESGSEDTSKK